jgi:hypothetical protein
MLLDQNRELLAKAESIAKDEIREMERILDSERKRILAETEAERQRFASFREGVEAERTDLEASLSRLKAEIASVETEERKNGILARENAVMERESALSARMKELEASKAAYGESADRFDASSASLDALCAAISSRAADSSKRLDAAVLSALKAKESLEAVRAGARVDELMRLEAVLTESVATCAAKVSALDASISENRAMMAKLVDESRAVESRQADLRNAWTEAKRKGIL